MKFYVHFHFLQVGDIKWTRRPKFPLFRIFISHYLNNRRTFLTCIPLPSLTSLATTDTFFSMTSSLYCRLSRQGRFTFIMNKQKKKNQINGMDTMELVPSESQHDELTSPV